MCLFSHSISLHLLNSKHTPRFRLNFYEKDLRACYTGMMSRDTHGRKWAQVRNKGPPTLMILITFSLELLWFRYFSLLFLHNALEICFNAMKKKLRDHSELIYGCFRMVLQCAMNIAIRLIHS